MRKLFAAVGCALAVMCFGATAALAGEITGNGKPLWTGTFTDPATGEVFHTLHGKSACAFSGQEDLQFVDDNGNPLATPTKGVPGHAQSWGQIPKDFRDFLTSVGANPGNSCNPTKSGGEPA
jgi:hypothetical protein